jgi:hypothetical protein
MADEQRSAASSIYPNLKSAERPVQRSSSNSLADAMFPHLAVKPPSDPYREAALAFWRAAGLVPIK